MPPVRNSAGLSEGPPRVGLLTGVRELLRLLRHAKGDGPKHLIAAIVATALATSADIASLVLLQRAATGLLGGGRQTVGPTLLVAFLAAALTGSMLRFWAQRRTVIAQYALTEALAVAAFTNLQNQDYAEYVANGASEGFATFDRLQIVSFNALAPLIAGTAALLTVVALLATLVVLYPGSAPLVAMAIPVLAIVLLRRGKTGQVAGLSTLARARARLLFEARHAFRDIFMINAQQRMCEDFAGLEHAFRQRQSQAILAAQSSRHGFEIAVLGAALILALSASPAQVADLWYLPALGVLALAALRMLPSLATLRSSLHQIGQHGDVTGDVLALLERKPRRAAAAGAVPRLDREIRLDGITVRRAGRPDTLRCLDLTVPRGARIGIVGASGSGKSTLLDVICGALQPDGGAVLIDGVALDPAGSTAWRDRIGVVSQNSALLGSTLREAVTYPQHAGEIDQARFAAAVTGSGVAAMAGNFAAGLDTEVGEALATLSGGQRQRLALAHALYRACDLLLLDEATGQLDGESERAVIEAIAALPHDLTIVVVTHRPALLECCEVTYSLEDGVLRQTV
ncbi:MAG TPA: ABC transporter ATP-binding protein [Novosphingobium sp.]|nr:ABC transporter ATP-binding protein [Novosphingobium sp.]